jgi:intracellular multiplication protein IcmW
MMPDLSNEACHKFWYEYRDPMIYRVVSFMESVEDWSLDNDSDLEASMQRLGEALEDVGNIDLQHEEEFIKIAAYVKAGRGLRLLQTLDTAFPGAASKLLMYAEEHSTSSEDVPGLFLRRNIVFERLRLLGRVFAPERFALIAKALESE